MLSTAAFTAAIPLKQQGGHLALPSVAFLFESVLRTIPAPAALYCDYLQSQRQGSCTRDVVTATGHANKALAPCILVLHGATQGNAQRC